MEREFNMTKHRRHLLLIVLYLAYTAIYIARLNLTMASPELKSAGILDAAQIGMLGSAFSVIYACGRLLNGYLGDRVPPWALISLGLFFSGISNLCISFFPPFIGMLLLWSVNAISQSMLWSSVLRILSMVYDSHKAKKVASYMVTSVATGNIIGILVSNAVIKAWGIGWAFLIPGTITLVFAGIVLLTARNVTDEHKTEGSAKAVTAKELLRNSGLQKMLVPALLHGIMKDNISLWMAVYVVDRFGVKLDESAYYILLVPAVGLVGRLLYPPCYTLAKKREHRVSTVSFIACALFSLWLLIGPTSPLAAVICLSAIYAATSLINTSTLSIYPIRFAEQGGVSAVSGIMDFATYGGAGIGSLAFGFLIKHFGYWTMFAVWLAVSLISIPITEHIQKQQSKELKNA